MRHSQPVEGSTLWFKSSYSGGSGTECIEVAALACAVTAVRDSKVPWRGSFSSAMRPGTRSCTASGRSGWGE
ncbi:DUF397 domain-containing protein [Streptomyces sp. GSL17-111]|uniref:DUF397 domain-containing protein n=1 Tax=Streptomyces sp. GSL17-111 TaxID=3121596 RepID=UPI0030F3C2E2